MKRKHQPRMPRPQPKAVGPAEFVAEALRLGVAIVQYCHDDHCSHWCGKGCDCDVEVRLIRPFDREERRG